MHYQKLTYHETFLPLKVVCNDLVVSGNYNTGGYRYGFQGQEMDDEVKGKGNSVNYKYRMHDPRVGRFFAVDPLTSMYSHNSPYAFSENEVINSIELEGLEKLQVTEVGCLDNLNAGTAKIIISMDYIIVTVGPGGVSNTNAIVSNNFKKSFNRGNTTMYATNLPDNQDKANFLEGRNARLAKNMFGDNDKKSLRARNKLNKRGVNFVYKIDVEYNYSIKTGTTFTDAIKQKEKDPHGIGIVLTTKSLTNEYSESSMQILYETFKNSDLKESSTVGGNDNLVFLNESSYGDNPSRKFNETAVDKHGNSYVSLDGTEIVVHGAGHNAAFVNSHKNASYHYTYDGLQSSVSGRVFPTSSNTKNIINDANNRKTIGN